MKNRVSFVFISIVTIFLILSGCGKAAQESQGSSADANGLASLQATGGDTVTIDKLLWTAESSSSGGANLIEPTASQNNGATTIRTFTISDSDLGSNSGLAAFEFKVETAN